MNRSQRGAQDRMRPLPFDPLASDTTFRNMVETMSVGLGIRDVEGVITYVNGALCNMLGYAPEEMVGRRVTDFLSPACRELFERETDRRRQGESQSYEMEMSAKDGRQIATIQSPRALFDPDGQFVGSFAVITDITERKERLRESEERYRSLFDGVPIGLYRTTPAGRMLDANEALVRILG